MLLSIINWISHTAASDTISNATWIIPLFQTIHIMAIAVVVSTMGMLDLRLMGVAGTQHSMRSLVDRYVPWMWVAVIVLLCTGVVLITGEPERSLGNWVFQVKMGLLATVLLVTVGFSRTIKHNLDSWERAPTHQLTAKATGLVSLLLWVGIVIAGRWIAYVS